MLQQLADLRELKPGGTVKTRFTGHTRQSLLASCPVVLLADHEEAPNLAPGRIAMAPMNWTPPKGFASAAEVA